ncbi:hypothetical protein AMAG_01729 [Allomyces macrogynus ATCC 38327]|uniref:Uncharacterized protein n=1 Tax=Allomyces macrogynus (strain ATCC 38327) TaxID=578462 RepID=A0A0L0S0J0_ALLM3|nr:hypothetical protein AMAG_01729 [Allomyces macrogynus ATCC 38327]|eukprot:KNE55859.1 hypothetical protein AMAG_01729 [Allomyces macrogynus ATCC 38327]
MAPVRGAARSASPAMGASPRGHGSPRPSRRGGRSRSPMEPLVLESVVVAGDGPQAVAPSHHPPPTVAASTVPSGAVSSPILAPAAADGHLAPAQPLEETSTMDTATTLVSVPVRSVAVEPAAVPASESATITNHGCGKLDAFVENGVDPVVVTALPIVTVVADAVDPNGLASDAASEQDTLASSSTAPHRSKRRRTGTVPLTFGTDHDAADTMDEDFVTPAQSFPPSPCAESFATCESSAPLSVVALAASHGPPVTVSKSQLVRVLIEEIRSLGFASTAATLERESGVPLEPDHVVRFRDAILAGQWATAVGLVPAVVADEASKPPPRLVKHATALIREQQYLEYLERSDVTGAVLVLQSHLAPLGIDPAQLSQLASYLMFSPAQLYATTGWPGAYGGSRHELFETLRTTVFAPTTTVVGRRLETLLRQALEHEQATCAAHTGDRSRDDGTVPLLHGHVCTLEAHVPAEQVRVLSDMGDEVWHVAFSHVGDRVAAVGCNGVVVVWDVQGTDPPVHVVASHEPLTFIAWSDDDRYLLTSGHDEVVRMWDSHTIGMAPPVLMSPEPATIAIWLPGNQGFVTGGAERVISIWRMDGSLAQYWDDVSASHLQVCRNARYLVAGWEDEINVFDLESLTHVGHIIEDDTFTSLAFSSDSRHLLVSLESQEMHMWDLFAPPPPLSLSSSYQPDAAPPPPVGIFQGVAISPSGYEVSAALSDSPPPAALSPALVRVYRGHQQGEFVIRSALGGPNEALVASGSEDGRAYVWDRASMALVQVLDAHSATVNAVAFNPVVRDMLATCSDDGTVRIWRPRPPVET